MGLLKPYKVLLLDEITVDLDIVGRLALLEFLEEECALTAENIADVIERFPEVVGCSVEDQLQAAVDHLAKTSFIPKGKFRTKTVLRKPEFLGYNIDCTAVGSGSCAGECNRCWVRL